MKELFAMSGHARGVPRSAFMPVEERTAAAG
jgi:hypothetical protein